MVGTVGASSPRGDPCSSTSVTCVRVDILSKEYPPQIYGGAGVHVAELVAGAARPRRHRRAGPLLRWSAGRGRAPPGTPTCRSWPPPTPPCRPSGSTWRWPADCVGADLVHSHTWYANMAGHLGSLLAGMPHVVSAHSLEPLRPWKAEQLGGGYAISSWVERTAYEAAAGIIAVSAGMRADVLQELPLGRPRPGSTSCTTASTPSCGPRAEDHGRRPPPRRRPRPALGRLRRADHPAEGAALLPARRPRRCRRRCSSCSAPARPTPRRSRPRSRR